MMLNLSGNWDPFAQMRRLQSEMNQLFESAAPGFGAGAGTGVYPPVNLWQGHDGVAVTAELPGLGSEDVDITVREDTLTIRGERKPDDGEPPTAGETGEQPGEQQGGQAAWHRRERPVGAFSRTIVLPFRVDPDQVEARFENGLLQVELRRPEADRPRKIVIKNS
jgi:HSP20 family protein